MYQFGMILCVCVGVTTPDCRSMSVCVRIMLNAAWDLLLSSFMLVAATVRDLFPSDIRDSMSCHKCSRDKWKNSVWQHTDSKDTINYCSNTPCSWQRPGERDHQRRAQKRCALSLSVHVDFCREKEKLINLLFRIIINNLSSISLFSETLNVQ